MHPVKVGHKFSRVVDGKQKIQQHILIEAYLITEIFTN